MGFEIRRTSTHHENCVAHRRIIENLVAQRRIIENFVAYRQIMELLARTDESWEISG
jgi:hypothetical protein